jgi:hypothetical protein
VAAEENKVSNLAMAEDAPEALQAVDESLLTDVVRRALDSPAFRVTTWSVRRLSDKGVINPNGLWRFSGDGRDERGARSWSVVLKMLTREEQERPPADTWYWKREMQLALSGLTDRLPGPVRAPRFYHAEETPTGAWVWMEHVRDSRAAQWSIDDYSFAARQLGLWNGACFLGMPLPDEPWLCRKPFASWLSWVNISTCWDAPVNQQHVSAELRARHERLWTERDALFAVLHLLPQVFCHFDSQRRNAFIRRGSERQDELVLADWAICGLLPLGAELNGLVGASCLCLEWSPAAIRELSSAAFENYVQGLRQSGWTGNEDEVRLGYTGCMAAWFGCIFPAMTAMWCAPQDRFPATRSFGAAEEELFWKWLPLFEFSMDCADEARALTVKLGLR